MKFLLFALLALLRPAPASNPYTGTWLVADRDAQVEIILRDDVYTGRYVGFTDPAAARQQGYEVGGIVLKNMRQEGGELVGVVVDVETKKEYDAELSAPAANRVLLKVKKLGLTVHSETWTRAAAARSAVATPAPASPAKAGPVVAPAPVGPKKTKATPAGRP